ncbi:MAG TPA: NFACT RNA binding domain-containing protein, partial [Bacillota bacterium]|nr:NFACT RNA binding domain-containing protein [Bacillota bacterium]
NTPQKKQESGIMTFRTDGGFIVLCGRNNLQNEHLTHRLASKDDFWFHVKERPGSHVVLVTNGREPGEVDFTQAARIAALYSSARDGQNVPVDYTPVKNLKKTPGSRPGFVIYHTNWTAYVTPDPGEAERLRVKTE